MAEYMRIFAVENIEEIHLAFLQARRQAAISNAHDRRRGAPPAARSTLSELDRLYAKFNADLDRAAATSAARATRAIVRRIERSRVRPETDKPRHLASLVASRPVDLGLGGVATGAVGIADIGELNKAIDPDYPAHGPYWEAQEYGTTAHVGREIRGFFHGGAPAARPSGALFRVHSAFSPSSKFTPAAGAGSRGGKGGKGTIRRPIKPRYFIRDGADSARGAWRAAVFAAEDEFVSGLDRSVARRRGRARR